MKKCRVAVLFGGVSGEHEVSLRSAASVIHHLDKEKFEVLPVGITKDGTWLLQDAGRLKQDKDKALILQADARPLDFSQKQGSERSVDVVFPVMHGTYCEDGCMQGFLETLSLPYVGAGVLGSAIGMDKVVSKQLARAAGIPVADFIELRFSQWQASKEDCIANIITKLKLPLFVKPVSAGSSVGIHKVKTKEQLIVAIQDAFGYESRLIIEEGIVGREIEVSVLEDLDFARPPRASLPGEIKPAREFYDYTAKYLDPNGALLCVPADLPMDITSKVREMAAQVFLALQCDGMARADFFLEDHTNRIVFNEINTLPGFTAISMYPQLWQVSGMTYTGLLTHLIELAMIKHERKKRYQQRHTHNTMPLEQHGE